jgi:hypothetical protein
MPTDMTSEEVDDFLHSAKQIDSFDFRNEDDDDDYFTMTLYESKDGRCFRIVESSGMDSRFSGAGNFGEWLTAEEIEKWHEV